MVAEVSLVGINFQFSNSHFSNIIVQFVITISIIGHYCRFARMRYEHSLRTKTTFFLSRYCDYINVCICFHDQVLTTRFLVHPSVERHCV